MQIIYTQLNHEGCEGCYNITYLPYDDVIHIKCNHCESGIPLTMIRGVQEKEESRKKARLKKLLFKKCPTCKVRLYRVEFQSDGCIVYWDICPECGPVRIG